MCYLPIFNDISMYITLYKNRFLYVKTSLYNNEEGSTMNYLNLINGRNESDLLTSLTRQTSERANTINSILMDRNSSALSRITKNYSVMKNFKHLYKVMHPRMKDAVSFIYECFPGNTPSEVIGNIYVDRGSIGYQNALVKATMAFREIFGLTNINVCFDNSLSSGNIRVTFDANRKPIELFTGDVLDPLSFTVNEFGYPDFSHNDDVVMTIFIPVNFLKNIFMHANQYVIYKTGDSDTNKPEASLDSVFSIVRKIFNIELKNAIIVSLYKDRFRELILSQLTAVYYIILEETKDNSFSFSSRDNFVRKLHERYLTFIKKFKISVFEGTYQSFDTYDVTLTRMLSMLGGSKMNVLDFINRFIDLGSFETKEIIKKLGLWVLYPNTDYYPDIEYLNKSKGNEFADVVRTTILLNRITPFVYLTESIIGNGERYSELVKFNTKMINYIDNTLIPCAARYHRLHRNSLSYQIDKLRNYLLFYRTTGFRVIRNCILDTFSSGSMSMLKDEPAQAIESWDVVKTNLLGTTIKDYMADVTNNYTKEPKNIVYEKPTLKSIKKDVFDFINVNNKQKRKAPKNIEKMFDLVRKKQFFYIGYNPCNNIDLKNKVSENIIEETGSGTYDESMLREERQNAYKILMESMDSGLIRCDDMDINEYAVLGNVGFIGMPSTPFRGCMFVYNRKTGELVLDEINRGVFVDCKSDSEYADIIDFFKCPEKACVPSTLYKYYNLWKEIGTGGRFESPEDYIVSDRTIDLMVEGFDSNMNRTYDTII